jgi:predicted secreted protein
MRAARGSAVALAVLVLAGCGQTHRQSPGRTLHLTAKDNDKEFSVKPHETIVVTLASNRTTGYGWHGVPDPFFGRSFRLLSHRYVAPTRGAPGAAGKESWRYRPIGRGGGFLVFSYARQHTRFYRPTRRFAVSIKVG